VTKQWMTAVSLVFVSACLGTGPTETALGEEFVLRANQSVRVAGTELTVGFRRVVDDSRCPIDALCAVEGEADVELDLFGSSATAPVLVSTPFPRDWVDGQYQVTVLDLQPLPVAGAPIDPNAYRVRLKITLAP
jgi:hypothetical protein